MSQVSKKKFWEILKQKETYYSLFDYEPEDWLTGYRRWKKQQEKYNVKNNKPNS